MEMKELDVKKPRGGCKKKPVSFQSLSPLYGCHSHMSFHRGQEYSQATYCRNTEQGSLKAALPAVKGMHALVHVSLSAPA